MGNRSDKYTAPADSTVGASGPVIIEDNLCTARTFDLWPRMGKDGRDYGLVGTWGEDGYGTIYNITDRSNIVKTDSIKIDACTINDATVSLGGRFVGCCRVQAHQIALVAL